MCKLDINLSVNYLLEITLSLMYAVNQFFTKSFDQTYQKPVGQLHIPGCFILTVDM